ncbi:MAG TPA: hypothetical protein VGB85_11935 [Nannocystis sp.]|jgi:hypothetical protein
MRDLEKLRRAAEALDRDTSITLLTSHDQAPEGVSRVGGPGFDLGDRQPQGEEQPMTHLWTLATADVPALANAFPGAAAVALYMADPEENEAYEAFNGLTALVPVSAEDIARGEAEPTGQDLGPRHVTAEHLEVASSAFVYDSEDEDASPRRVLRNAIYGASARAGGGPIWLQGDEHEGDFLLQFDESFASVNLGDCGIMYVFTDTQFWQCH